MGALKDLVAAILLAASAPAQAQVPGSSTAGVAGRPDEGPIGRWSPHIREASDRFAIPEDWIRRVIRAESGGRTRLGGRPTTSRAGAMGLMQLMPGTWAAMRSSYALGSDPHDPRDNILAGTAYLRAMYDRFGYPGLFAAYNAGPGRYSEYLSGRRPLPAETVAYLASLGLEQSGAFAAAHWSGELFVRLSNRAAAGSDQAPPAAPPPGSGPALFVRLGGLLAPER